MKKPGKAMRNKIMKGMMLAHEAGIQKGAAMAGGAGGPPPGTGPGMPPPGMKPPGAPPAMKAGGPVKKNLPPWLKKSGGGKYAAGGIVSGARGDGCCTKGRTRGRMR